MMSESTVPALNREQQDMLSLLIVELQEQLDTSLEEPAPESAEALGSWLERRSSDLENLENAAELIGLGGLSEVCCHLRENVQAVSPHSASEAVLMLAASSPMYLLAYVQQLQSGEQDDPESIESLLQFLSDPAWPLPCPDGDRLQGALTQPEWETPEEVSAPSGPPRQANAQMLTLKLGEDINPRLFEGLMLELPGQMEQFSDTLSRFIQTRAPEALQRAQRITHTVKGSANVVGVTGLANWMHYSEDFLDLLERMAPTVPEGIDDFLMEMVDTAASLLDHLLDATEPGDEALQALQHLFDRYHQLAAGDLGDPPKEPSTAAPATDEGSASVEPERAVEPTQIRVAESGINALLTLSGEASIGNHRLTTQTHRARSGVLQLQQLQQKLNRLTEELGQVIELRNLFANHALEKDQSLDPLELDRYNELHSFYHQLQEYAADANDLILGTKSELSTLNDLLQTQQRHQNDAQQQLLDMLSVPARQLESRLQRCVRQACRLTGKQVELHIEGAQAPLDRNALQQLADPLMHLLRNAVDHGIESADERAAQNKPEAGQLHLRFRSETQSTLIELSDDGGGLNHERILERAEALELTPPENADAQWLESLIFLPGFSTRETVSQTSGRGVGLDAVTDQLKALQGQISVQSEPGLGTLWRLVIPNRLIAEHQLLVQAGSNTLSLSSRGVQQVVFMEPEQLSNDGDALFYRYGEQVFRVWHLSQVARLPGTESADTRQAQAVLMLQSGQGEIQGLLIDRILASREMVVKPLPAFCPELPGVLGATVLGDGQVAPVLDAIALVETASKAIRHHSESPLPTLSKARPLALIVDDSLSTRRSLVEFVTELGLDVVTAKDGFEAIDRLQERTPSLVLVDMEMPRMNGLEFTAHLRAQEALRDIPVIMITSRNTEKHRELARTAGVDRYLNKPFSEVELLNSIESSLH
ncbi:hybrid sensor histidine kinase/response regulator [Marinimicrobium agarilyticum]|uniref:hybrid sensor histidine kinase/response regulator n=1 Tax=Marinimicrobium agarilyticum TaxID=306546 RepID=UPI00041784B2|nr:response regulator [Marinimicrobium agarilyticum]